MYIGYFGEDTNKKVVPTGDKPVVIQHVYRILDLARNYSLEYKQVITTGKSDLSRAETAGLMLGLLWGNGVVANENFIVSEFRNYNFHM